MKKYVVKLTNKAVKTVSMLNNMVKILKISNSRDQRIEVRNNNLYMNINDKHQVISHLIMNVCLDFDS